jgi:hypothetical protein
LLLLDLPDVLNRRADGHQLVLGLLPLTVVDQLLHLRELRRCQRHPIVAGGLLLAEDRGPHAVEGVTGTRAVHGGPETADAEHRGGHRSDDREQPAGPAVLRQPGLQRLDGIVGADGHGDRRVAHVVAPPRQQERQFGFLAVGGVHRMLGSERFDEAVGAGDFVE